MEGQRNSHGSGATDFVVKMAICLGLRYDLFHQWGGEVKVKG